MTTGSGEFKWLSPQQADKQLRRELSERDQKQSFVDQAMHSLPELAEWYQGILSGTRESRTQVSRYAEEARQHLGELGVFGFGSLSDDDLKQIGPLLAREGTYREDAVFHILHSRRLRDVPIHIRRYTTVNKHQIKQYGLASQSGRIDLDDIQNEKTMAAKELVEPLVNADEFEDAFLGSDMKRRILRAIYYVLSEPTGTSEERLLKRLQRQADEGDPLSASDIVGRLYGHVSNAYDRASKSSTEALETEETMVQLLEEARLSRLRELGRTVLVPGLGVISPSEE